MIRTTSATVVAAVLLSAGLLTSCGRPFEPRTPAGFVELNTKWTDYDYRATTADGLVIGIRVEKHKPRGELAFWERAIENHLRMRGGYALLDKRDVTNANGTRGRQLRFGHDEAGKPHLYSVTLYPTKRRLFIVEAGGPKAEVERNAALIDETIRQFRIKRCWKYGCNWDAGTPANETQVPAASTPVATTAAPNERPDDENPAASSTEVVPTGETTKAASPAEGQPPSNDGEHGSH